MPFLLKVKEVTVAVITDKRVREQDALGGTDAVNHLTHHGIDAVLRRIKGLNGGVAATLIVEAKRRRADLIFVYANGYSEA